MSMLLRLMLWFFVFQALRQVWKLFFPKVIATTFNGKQTSPRKTPAHDDAIEANYRVLKEPK